MHYEARWIVKRVEEDDFEKGVIATIDEIEIYTQGFIRARTFPELLKKCEKYIGFEIKEVSIPPNQENDVKLVEVVRQEDEDGNEPDEENTRLWKDGLAKQFMSTYSIYVFKVETLTAEEIEQSGVRVDY